MSRTRRVTEESNNSFAVAKKGLFEVQLAASASHRFIVSASEAASSTRSFQIPEQVKLYISSRVDARTALPSYSSMIAPPVTAEWLHSYEQQNHSKQHGQQVARGARLDRARTPAG